MDQEDGKMGTENPPQASSSPLSSGKDDIMSNENHPEGTSNPLSSDDTMCTEYPPELSSNPPSSAKDDMMGTENHPEVSSNALLSANDNMTDTVNPTEVSLNPPSPGKDFMMGTENSPEVSSDQPSSGKDGSKKDADPSEGSSKPELRDKNTQQSLKAKSKIVKKSQASKLKARKNNGSQQIREKKRIRKNKKVVDNAESCHNADKKQISDNSQQKETNDEPPKNSQEAENNEVKESQNRSTSNKNPAEKIHLLDKTEQKMKNKEKHRESNKSSRGRENKDKQSGIEESQSKEKKSEKLGGLIFMCNAKTKLDCFCYRVMGVSAGKKDVALQVKPGLKLFLYDFDLKLLYGIYKASSSGGMRLEPRAFGGKFPAQVRFNIASDCFPLPESIFKKAIKDNYNEKHKFRTELTVRQVRQLTQLFQPAGIHSAVQPIHSPPKAIIRERESPDDVRGSWPHSRRESYHVQSHVRDHQLGRQEDITHDLFLMEKNYRAYGLRGDSYKGEYEHRRNVPARVESMHTDPLYLSDSRHQNYFHDTISHNVKDPYYVHSYGASPRDAYLRREEISSSSYLVGERPFVGTNNLLRRETVQDRRYSIYSAADALSDYNPMRPCNGDKLESSLGPVSSRYSFASPSFSRR
ncbi:uncharacterized protein LOC113867443 isoform X2 [Abrus precatorius]|uniref:Uncharacterized protein LOC113867443 isoform X2 n=1 Tax=Abrus precatorius TaxID=3816 RepID=A0A8B8LSY7_ABRPR|nr:uncharacterized protein LOC113867443 isoform X2 [Abrus precatorius]